MNTGTKVFAGLKAILASVSSGRDVVTIEDFGNILNWCGPMLSDKEEDNFVTLVRYLNLLSHSFLFLASKFIYQKMVPRRY
jgi:hypothetical protein